MRHPEAEAILGPHAADAVDIARRHFGHMSERQRDAILVALRSKMADRRRPHLAAWSLATAGAVAGCAVVSLVATRHRWHADALSFRVEGGELGAGGSVEAGATGPRRRSLLGRERGHARRWRARPRAHGRRARRERHARRGAGPRLRRPRPVDALGVRRGTVRRARHRHRVRPVVGGGRRPARRAPRERERRGERPRVRNAGRAPRRPVAHRPVARSPHPRSRRDRRRRQAQPLGSRPHPPPASASPGPKLGGRRGRRPKPRPPRRRPSVETHRRAPRARVPSSAAAPQGHGWAAELADGKFASIVDEALGLGLEPVYAGSGGDDLAALADAARYTRHYDVARGALLAQRQRFSASERARVAAFSLGRLSEAQRDDRAALSWFETYLQEAPEGTYASEALGRKMLLVEQLDGSDAARPLAAAYLHRFPSGTYAKAAHAIAPGP